MKIKLNPLDKNSVDEALKQVKAYKAKLEARRKTLINRLAEEGVAVASVRFAAAEYDGTNDVTVAVQPTAKGVRIVASGQAVCFIEFGSGVARGGGYPGERPAGIVGLGEYGKGHGATGEPWYYEHGHKSDGNPPAMAMWGAEQTVLEKVTQVAREVFAGD